MNEILSAIWIQDFDTLLEINSLHILLLLLAVVLFLESSFVFLPLPGDGLVLFVGGLVGLGAVDFYTALTVLSLSACLGTIIGYLQGRWLEGSRFMNKIEVVLPDDSLPRAKRLLNKFGFLSLFVSRFIPFVRVLTPMLMGVARLSFIRTVMISHDQHDQFHRVGVNPALCRKVHYASPVSTSTSRAHHQVVSLHQLNADGNGFYHLVYPHYSQTQSHYSVAHYYDLNNRTIT
ncbi:DedA family protein [Vibrio splendidus]|uniref:DedA family protein n=1 Tax=Vibrio splendidus TaxID=29497 RepID=UPI001F53AE34|nr:DedA family protein [Vibrio splendidus]